MKCPDTGGVTLKLITFKKVLIKNKIQSVLFFNTRLSQRESGWALFPPGGWIMHGQQKHERSSEGVRGAMTHRVSSYTSQRCADWSCGEQNDWVTTYHKTTPNQFQIELAAALISVTHSFYMLHYCGAHWISVNKKYTGWVGHAVHQINLCYTQRGSTSHFPKSSWSSTDNCWIFHPCIK